MIDPAKQRFIDHLEEEAAHAHEEAQVWRELEKQGVQHLEHAQGKIIATAAEMAKKDEDLGRSHSVDEAEQRHRFKLKARKAGQSGA